MIIMSDMIMMSASLCCEALLIKYTCDILYATYDIKYEIIKTISESFIYFVFFFKL